MRKVVRKLCFLLILILFFINSGHSQVDRVIADTTEAGEYFLHAEELLQQALYDSASLYFGQAGKVYEEYRVWDMYLNSMNKKAYCQILNGQYDQALGNLEKLVTKGLEVFSEKSKYAADSYNYIGIALDYQGNFDASFDYYNRALLIRQNLFGELSSEAAKSYNNIGILYYYIADYQEAIKYFDKALSIYEELYDGKHALVASFQNNIGVIYESLAEYDLALEYHDKALKTRKLLFGEHHPEVAHTYSNIGIVLFNNREFDLALEYYQMALTIYLDFYGEIHTQVAGIYNNMANAYRFKASYDPALEYLLKAVDIYIELFGDNHTEVAAAYNNIANIYSDMEKYEQSIKYDSLSLKIKVAEFGEVHPDVGLSYANIATTSRYIGKYNQALVNYRKALTIYDEIYDKKHPKIANIYYNIGLLYYEMGEEESVIPFLQKALVANHRSFNDTINLYSNPPLNDYYDYDLLMRTLRVKAIAFQDSYLQKGDLKHLEASIQTSYCCDSLIDQIRLSMNTKSDKISLGAKAYLIYDGAIDACYKMYQATGEEEYLNKAFYFSEKNKAGVLLEALAGAEAQKFANIPDKLLRIEDSLSADIAYYKKELASAPDSTNEYLIRSELFKLNRTYDSLIVTFEQQYEDYFNLKYNRKVITVEELQSLLDKKTALISYFIGDSVMTIFTVTRKSLSVNTYPAVYNLADTVTELRYSLLYGTNERFGELYKKSASRLYKRLIPDHIKKRIRNLIIIPEAELCMIPFESLLYENPGSRSWTEMPFLIKKFNISYTYSGKLFYKTFPKIKSSAIETTDLKDWLAIAPVFNSEKTTGLTLRTRALLEQNDNLIIDSLRTRGKIISRNSISSLPGTEDEVKNIFNAFNEKKMQATVRLNEDASEDFIKSGQLANYRFLHIATHGFVNTVNTELSGILLAYDSTGNEDGILHTGEIFNLNLNADLTVLSACETGLGRIRKGEGLIGLSRALLYAGSKSIIVSLWKVADESTSRLMIDFYKYHLNSKKAGDGFSPALRAAKLKMIEEEKYAAPYYWSPFILIGK